MKKIVVFSMNDDGDREYLGDILGCEPTAEDIKKFVGLMEIDSTLTKVMMSDDDCPYVVCEYQDGRCTVVGCSSDMEIDRSDMLNWLQ